MDSEKDLGVTVSNNLTWRLHFSIVVAKAYRILGFLRDIVLLMVSHASHGFLPDRKSDFCARSSRLF